MAADRHSVRRDDAAIRAAGERTDVALPPDLAASPRRHDGCERTAGGFTLPPARRPMPTAEIARD